MVMLTIVLFILLPFAALSLAFVAGAIFAHGTGSTLNRLVLVVIFSIPPLLWGWGFRVLSRLRNGFTASARRRLLVFYTLLLAYCGMWMVSPISHDHSEKFMLFGIFEVVIIVGILSIPIFATLFTKPNQAEQVTSEDLV